LKHVACSHVTASHHHDQPGEECRDEFRKHTSAKEKFLGPFFREWDRYLEMLTSTNAAGGTLGADLGPDAVAALTDEQKEQLSRLRQEVHKPSAEG
jgi:arylsulfatase A-like enzyme